MKTANRILKTKKNESICPLALANLPSRLFADLFGTFSEKTGGEGGGEEIKKERKKKRLTIIFSVIKTQN